MAPGSKTALDVCLSLMAKDDKLTCIFISRYKSFARRVSAPQSTQQTWTVPQHSGPNHLGLWLKVEEFHTSRWVAAERSGSFVFEKSQVPAPRGVLLRHCLSLFFTAFHRLSPPFTAFHRGTAIAIPPCPKPLPSPQFRPQHLVRHRRRPCSRLLSVALTTAQPSGTPVQQMICDLAEREMAQILVLGYTGHG